MSSGGAAFVRNRRVALLQSAARELEWRRCCEDERYFFSRYARVMSSAPEHQPAGQTLFELWDFQVDALEAFAENPLVVVAKSRQLGLTTLAMLDTFWRGFFHDGRYEVLVVSKDQDAADNNLRMLSATYQFLPAWMKARGPQRVDDAATKITFQKPNGASFRITSVPGTSTRGAGTTPSRIIADEYALMDKQDDVARVLSPAIKAATSGDVTNGAAMIMISTPRGNKNRFASTFLDAWNVPGSSPWKAMYFPVTCNKFLGNVGESDAGPALRAEAARRVADKCELVEGDQVLADEFWLAWEEERQQFKHKPHLFFSEWSRSVDEAFQSSSNRRFSLLPSSDAAVDFPFHGELVGDASISDTARPAQIAMFETDTVEAIEARWHFRYLDHELNAKFLSREVVVSVDPSKGVGKDDTAITVLADCVLEDGSHSAEVLAAFWSSEIRPKDVAREIFLAARRFAPAGKQAALVVVERPNAQAGDGTIVDTLRHMNFPLARIYRHRTEGKARNRNIADLGYPMNMKTKPKVLGDLETMFVLEAADSDEVSCRLVGLFPELLRQLETYLILSREGQSLKCGADAGCHDDLVMSAAIGVSVLSEAHTRYVKPDGNSAQSVRDNSNSSGRSVLQVKNLYRKQAERTKKDQGKDQHLHRRADALLGRLK